MLGIFLKAGEGKFGKEKTVISVNKLGCDDAN